MESVAIIPARGGSKSLPRKNLRMLNGKPLIAHSIEIAKACPSIGRVIVTTDCEEIAALSRTFGAEVPFLRPALLAGDITADWPVFQHCLEWLKSNEGYMPEVIVHLRPTSPLRTVAMVEEAITMLKNDPAADSVRTVCPPKQNPYKMWALQDGYLQPLLKGPLPEAYNQPRQLLPEVFWQNGYVDVIRSSTILEKKSMTGEKIRALVLDSSHSIDIDDLLTLQLAEGQRVSE